MTITQPPISNLQSPDPCYVAALDLVQQIEAYLAYGRPLCTKSGQRLRDLESAVRAILADDFPSPNDGRGAGGEGP